MAAPEHLQLASFIKNVHLSLRKKSKKFGHETAWKEHIEDSKCLQKYAESMKELATKYWDENSKKESSKAVSRIDWVYLFCQRYFFGNELQKHRQKEIEILKKIEDNSVGNTCDSFDSEILENELQKEGNMMKNEEINSVSYLSDKCDRLKLLDVGSCYNPFKIYECFEVLPIDVAPGSQDVCQCDFLNLKIGANDILNSDSVEQLKDNSFHIVVFSLLLEYLPSPEQRFLCCKNAYSLLKNEGILFIITPDSKHVGMNAKYMKSWRYVLAKLGFSRILYEKLPYLHCMVFRKSINCIIPQRWAKLHENDRLLDNLYIPQDFQDISEPEVNILSPEKDSVDFDFLSELPFSF